MPTVETLLNDILNQDDAGVQSSFAAVMMEKVGEIIDSKKLEMAQSIFQTEGTFPPKKDDSDDEDDSDDDSDDKEDDSDDSDEEEKSTKDDHLFKNTDKDDDSDDSDSSDDDKDVKTKKAGKKVTITVDE